MGRMRMLILGGTRFLGRAITEAALGRGDTVTLFNPRAGTGGLAEPEEQRLLAL
jgi:2'-hydroxyisoflavone reductase